MSQVDEIKVRIDQILYDLSKAVLAQKQVEENLEQVAGELLILGLQNDRINSPGVLSAQYSATMNSRQIIQALFDMRQSLTLQRDKL